MKSRALIVALSCLLLGAMVVGAQQDKPQAAPQTPSPAEMEAWSKSMTLGEQHKHMGHMVGDWTYTIKMWMAPGQPPQESNGTMHAESLMGGRYVEHHWSGNMMGMQFEGRGTDAYDNVTKKYLSSWIDNMGTGIATSTGTCEDGGKKCTFSGTMSDPMTGGTSTNRSVITWVDNDTFTNEMYGNDPTGKEMKMMEINAKRKK